MELRLKSWVYTRYSYGRVSGKRLVDMLMTSNTRRPMDVNKVANYISSFQTVTLIILTHLVNSVVLRKVEIPKRVVGLRVQADANTCG